MKEIVQNGDPVLRDIAKEVSIDKITSPEIKKVIKEMSEALATQDDGVAIAAPQIGYSYRIFVVAGKVLENDEEVYKKKDMVFINPVIKKLSKKTTWLEEGCLSVRPFWGEVKRSLQATIEAYDENGNKFTRGASGLLAHIFQHETDHLNGILFIDKARNIVEGKIQRNMSKYE